MSPLTITPLFLLLLTIALLCTITIAKFQPAADQFLPQNHQTPLTTPPPTPSTQPAPNDTTHIPTSTAIDIVPIREFALVNPTNHDPTLSLRLLASGPKNQDWNVRLIWTPEDWAAKSKPSSPKLTLAPLPIKIWGNRPVAMFPGWNPKSSEKPSWETVTRPAVVTVDEWYSIHIMFGFENLLQSEAFVSNLPQNGVHSPQQSTKYQPQSQGISPNGTILNSLSKWPEVDTTIGRLTVLIGTCDQTNIPQSSSSEPPSCQKIDLAISTRHSPKGMNLQPATARINVSPLEIAPENAFTHPYLIPTAPEITQPNFAPMAFQLELETSDVIGDWGLDESGGNRPTEINISAMGGIWLFQVTTAPEIGKNFRCWLNDIDVTGKFVREDIVWGVGGDEDDGVGDVDHVGNDGTKPNNNDGFTSSHMWLSITIDEGAWDQILGRVSRLQWENNQNDQNDQNSHQNGQNYQQTSTIPRDPFSRTLLPPPLRVRTFTIHCGTNVALWSTEWAASDRLLGDVSPGLNVSIRTQASDQPLTQTTKNQSHWNSDQSTSLMSLTMKPSATETKTFEVRTSLPGDMFWCPQTDTRLYSYASHATQEAVWKYTGHSTIVSSQQADEVIPISAHVFTITHAPTSISLPKMLSKKNPSQIDIVVSATMLVDVVELGEQFVSTPKGREWYFSLPVPATAEDQKSMFQPSNSTKTLIVYIDSVDESTGLYSGPKRYRVEVEWNNETRQSSRFFLPSPPIHSKTPPRPANIHNYYKFHVAIPMSGENPLGKVSEGWDANMGSLSELILHSGDAALPQNVHQTIRHHIPIERWLLDAQRSFGNGVDQKCTGNPLWCLPYPNPSGWDLVTKSTTIPSFQLNWVGLTGRNAEALVAGESDKPNQLVTRVTIHLSGAYRFGFTKATPLVDLTCIGVHVHCVAKEIEFKPDFVVFQILTSNLAKTNHNYDDNHQTNPGNIKSILFSLPQVTYILANVTDIEPKLNYGHQEEKDPKFNYFHQDGEKAPKFRYLDQEGDINQQFNYLVDPEDDFYYQEETSPELHNQGDRPIIGENVHITAYLELEWAQTFSPPTTFSKTLSPSSLALNFPYDSDVHQVPTALGMTFLKEKKSMFFFWLKWALIGALALLMIPLCHLIYSNCNSSMDAHAEETMTMLEDLKEETRRTTTAAVMRSVGDMVTTLTKALDQYQPPAYGQLNSDSTGMQLPEYDLDLESGESSKPYEGVSINQSGTNIGSGARDNHLSSSRSTINLTSLFHSVGPNGSVAGFKTEGPDLVKIPIQMDGPVFDVLTPYDQLFPTDHDTNLDLDKKEDEVMKESNQETNDMATTTTTTTTTATTTAPHQTNQ